MPDLKDPHTRLLAREAIASALYLALVLLGALVAMPESGFPNDAVLVRLMLGTALGLVLAHWVAFRLAARLTEESGRLTATATQEAAAQILGAVAVAALASVPFLVLDGAPARRTTMVILAALPSVTGLLIARLESQPWPKTLLRTGIVLLIALGVVAVKAAATH